MTGRTSSPDGALGGLAWGGDLWTDVAFLTMIAGTVTGAAGMIVWAAGSTLLLLAGRGPGPGPLDGGSGRGRRRGAGRGMARRTAPRRHAPHHPPRDAPRCRRRGGRGLVAEGPPTPGRVRHPRPVRGTAAGPGSDPPCRSAAARRCVPRPRLRPADLGVPLGRLGGGRRGPTLRASWEDVVLAICAPRSGKTTCPGRPRHPGCPRPCRRHLQQGRRLAPHPPRPRRRHRGTGVDVRPAERDPRRAGLRVGRPGRHRHRRRRPTARRALHPRDPPPPRRRRLLGPRRRRPPHRPPPRRRPRQAPA